MAEYIFDVMSQTSKLDWAKPFQRTGAFPLDRSAIFSSLADAELYALGLDDNKLPRDERGLGGTAYVGQVISVYEAAEEGAEAKVNAYIITPARTLMKLAATAASGDVVTDIANLQTEVSSILENIESLDELVAAKADIATVEEALSAKADTEAMEAALAEKAVKAEVEAALAEKANANDMVDALAKKANSADVESALAEKANSADVYNKTEVYTKTEVETYVAGQIGSAGHLNREIVEVLPDISETNADTIYMIKKAGGLVARDHYEEYMVINGAWEQIGDTYVDLSNYVDNDTLAETVEAINGAIALKADITALEAVAAEVAEKADSEAMAQALALKADKEQVASDIAAAVAPLAVKTEVEASLALKADLAAFEELVENIATNNSNVETALGLKADKTEVESALVLKADKGESLADYGIADAYTKSEVDNALLLKASQQDHNELVDVVNGKADKADTLAGYGILDAYTKEEIDAALVLKANASEVYTKEETYTKEEISDLIAEITGGQSAAEVLDKLNKYTEDNDKRVEDVEDRIKALEDLEADDNIIEAIKLAGETTALEVVDKTVTLPAATNAKYGLVKLSNEIATNDNGELEIKAVNANKLEQSEGDWLILNGGTAAI